MKNKGVKIVFFFLIGFSFTLSILILAKLIIIEDAIKWLLLLIIFLLFILAASSFISIRFLNKREKKLKAKENELIKQIRDEPLKEKPNSVEESGVLDQWELSISDKEPFLKWEHNTSARKGWMVAGLIFVIGFLFLLLVSEGRIIPSLLISLLVGFIYGYARYFIASRKFNRHINKPMEVAFFKRHLLINRKIIVLQDDRITLETVDIKNKGMKVLEFCIYWYSTKGAQIRKKINIPISERYMQKVLILQSMYQDKINSKG